LASGHGNENLPVIEPKTTWPKLSDCVSSRLTRKLRDQLYQNNLQASLLRKKRFAVGVVDLSDIHRPVVAWLNPDVMMYAASLPKIAVLLAVMEAIDEAAIRQTEEITMDMKAMIRESDNEATTRLIDLVGFEKIESVVTSPRYRLFDYRKGGGLWVGKRYAKTGPRHGDPLKNISHGATVSQVCRFYYMLATGRLVSAEKSAAMLEIMAFPGKHHKFVHELETKYSPSRIFRKSGTWKTWHSDSVLLWSKDGKARYILVGLVEHPNGEQILRELVPCAERVLGITQNDQPNRTQEGSETP
jgi:beta-lactamase class A